MISKFGSYVYENVCLGMTAIVCDDSNPPKNGLIALWPSTNGAIPYFVVLPGSELSVTEITEYYYVSPYKPCREFKYTSE